MTVRTLEEKRRINDFVEEFIALQLKYNLSVESYDTEIWTQEDVDRALVRNPRSSIENISEKNIRQVWGRFKRVLDATNGNHT